MSPFNSYDYVFPVLGAAGHDQKKELREVCGTAFPLGGGAFLTAGHVLSRALTFDACDLGFAAGEGWDVTRTIDHEVLADYDIGVFRAVTPPRAETFQWDIEKVTLVEPVQATGFPHAWDSVNRVIAIRAFVGHTVCSRRWFRLQSAPLVYELSFACPRGLSGAPLWRVTPRATTVIGMILANEIMEMSVYTEKERLVGQEGTRELIKTEALHLGLALSASAILNAHSKTLGGSIGDWLRGQGKL